MTKFICPAVILKMYFHLFLINTLICPYCACAVGRTDILGRVVQVLVLCQAKYVFESIQCQVKLQIQIMLGTGNTFIWLNSTRLCMLSCCCLLTDFHIYVLLEFFKLQATTSCLQRRCHLSTWLSPSQTPVHANPDICHQVYMHFPFTTSMHFHPCRGKLIMESYKARTKARSMKKKTLLGLFFFLHLVTFIWKCLRVTYFVLILEIVLPLGRFQQSLLVGGIFYDHGLWPTSNVYRESYCTALTFASRVTSY